MFPRSCLPRADMERLQLTLGDLRLTLFLLLQTNKRRGLRCRFRPAPTSMIRLGSVCAQSLACVGAVGGPSASSRVAGHGEAVQFGPSITYSRTAATATRTTASKMSARSMPRQLPRSIRFLSTRGRAYRASPRPPPTRLQRRGTWIALEARFTAAHRLRSYWRSGSSKAQCRTQCSNAMPSDCTRQTIRPRPAYGRTA